MPTLKEVVACGTAVVLTPIGALTRGDERVEFGEWGTFKRLYEKVREIQRGEGDNEAGEGDKFGWLKFFDC